MATGIRLPLIAVSNKLQAELGSYANNLNEMLIAIKELNDEIIKYNPVASISPKVLNVMATIPRHKFVSDKYSKYAYNNIPLAIGYNQTISQPYIQALMTSLLALNKTSKVLEIGTGSGYQTAILSKLAAEVYTIEVIPELYIQAKKLLLAENYNNIKYACKNGKLGWNEYAPFDAIIVTAATKQEVPSALIEQLKINGRLVIPIEDKYGKQTLFLCIKHATNKIIKQEIMPVRFVPMM